MNDRRLIFIAAFLRALATGMAGVLLGLTLARLGFSAAAIGAVLSAGLAGATLALVVVTWAGDRLGRRRCLFVLSLLGADRRPRRGVGLRPAGDGARRPSSAS